MKGIQLTLEEKQILTEALLFTAVTDVCSEHTVSQCQRMIELAQRINNTDQKLHNIYIYEDSVEDELTTGNLIKAFPNLPRQTVITD